MTGNITKAECSHYWALPTHYMTAFCNHALAGHKRKNGLTSRLHPRAFKCFGQPTQERVLGSRTDAFSTHFTGFSICHPMYDDKHMLRVVQHATAFALNNQKATANFQLLPNWMENSTNGFNKTCTDNKDVCTILGNILKTKVCYMPLLYQQSKRHHQKQHGAYAS